MLGLPFPAGKALDALYSHADTGLAYRVKEKGLTFSLSGMENQVKKLLEAGEKPANIARFTLDTVTGIVQRVTQEAQRQYPGLPVLCSGGGGLQHPAAAGAGPDLWGHFRPGAVFRRQCHGCGHPHLEGTGGGEQKMRDDVQLFTPSQVNQYIKSFMDRDRLLSGLLVRGRAVQLQDVSFRPPLLLPEGRGGEPAVCHVPGGRRLPALSPPERDAGGGRRTDHRLSPGRAVPAVLYPTHTRGDGRPTPGF